MGSKQFEQYWLGKGNIIDNDKGQYIHKISYFAKIHEETPAYDGENGRNHVIDD